MTVPLTRRELLASFLGGSAALAAGCQTDDRRLPPAGELKGASPDIGHRLRDGFRPRPSDDNWEDISVIIVGGGIAGLSAAWRLQRAGFTDFAVLELESAPGGTSRSEDSGVVPHPWGAHYLPLPMKENRALIQLLDEMQVLDGRDADGEPLAAEQYLCRDPQERIFYQGRWSEGLYLHEGASRQDLAEYAAFQEEVGRWADWRDEFGRRAFAIPLATGSDDARVTELDKITMADWLERKQLTSPRLRWTVDYACRDDFGMTVDQTSAWAGLFYFASRMRHGKADSQPFITWPEGNGRFVDHLAGKSGNRVRSGWAVTSVTPAERDGAERVDVVATSRDGNSVAGFHAERVIFAAPHFLAPYLIDSYRDVFSSRAEEFEYGAWMVANVFLKDRPKQSRGFPLAWDNVLYESPSLGYVVATHQKGIDYGPTILTYYYPLCDADESAARRRLLSLSWEAWADVVLTDLSSAHPDIRGLVERLDVVRWGHAMIRPRPGFVWGSALAAAAKPFRAVHFANTDLSGVALFEEAFYHGNRAAEEVLAARDVSFESIL